MTDTETTAEALTRLPELKNPTVSPDGARVAFYHTGTGQNELHVLDLATGEREQWSDDGLPETVWPLWWTADGERVLYPYAPDGTEQNDVYAVGPDGETEPVLETDGTTNVRGVGPDGETLLVGSNHDGGMDLYCHDVPAGETTRLTNANHPVWTSHLSPSGDRVAYPSEAACDDGGSEVCVCDLDGEVCRVLDIGEPDSETSPADWGPDGESLLVSDDALDADRCGVYDLSADEVTWYGDGDHVEEPEFFLPGGERFVASRKRDATTVSVVYDAETGDSRELDLAEGVAEFGLRSERVVDDHRILVTHSTATRRAELLVYDLTTDEHEVVFERDYGPFSPEDFVAPDYFRVTSNGIPETAQTAVEHDPYETLDVGALFYDSGQRPSPLVVFPHGGPTQSDRREFQHRVQYLIQRGYSVLRVNFRGSTGRGSAFVRALYGDWGGAEQGDIATAVECVLDEHDWLDGDRVAVYGISYGGFCAYWQVVQYPGLYDAAAAVVGKTDFRDMYENTVPQFREGYMRRYLGTPDENPDLYRERSPITHATNLDAPLLMVHGENDPRVPVSQARRFRDALLDDGYEAGEDGDFEYHELGGSGHFGTTADGESHPLALVGEFLDRRLGPGK